MEEDKLQGNIRWHVQNTRVRAIMTCGCRCILDMLDNIQRMFAHTCKSFLSPLDSQHFISFLFFPLFLDALR